MYESSIDRIIFSMLMIVVFPIILLFSVHLLFLPSSESQDSAVTVEDVVPEDAEKVEVEEKEEVVEEEDLFSDEEFTNQLRELIKSGAYVIGIFVAGIIGFAGLMGLGVLLDTIYHTDKFQRWLFKLWMRKCKTPMPLREYYLFLDSHFEELPARITKEHSQLKEDIRFNKDEIKYASLAFIEDEFIDSFSKLRVILKNENYFKTFKTHYEQPTDVEMETVYKPIADAITDYQDRKVKYHKLSKDTDVNELNTLLTQSFTKLKAFNKNR